MILYIEGTNQDKDDKRKREGKEVAHSCYRKGNIYCRAVPDWVLYTRRTHGEATATTSVREEEDVVVLLSFRWVPSDDTLFILPGIQY